MNTFIALAAIATGAGNSASIARFTVTKSQLNSMDTEPDIYDAVAELRARRDEPSPRFTVCVSVGGVVQFFELTRAEIEETWRTVQTSILPQTFVGWYDEKSKWTQLGTKPAKF